MLSRTMFRVYLACLTLTLYISSGLAAVKSSSSIASAASPPAPAGSSTASPTVQVSPVAPSTNPSQTPTSPSSTATAGSVGSSTTGPPPDVLLNVPKLSVGRIELDVENLKADINLNANVASLVSINAGVAVSIQKVNLTIVDVGAELELIVRLGHLVDIVNRVFQSLDANPGLISAVVGNVTNLLKPIVGAVDGLLGTVVQGGTQLSFLVDNLGNIVQQVTGSNGTPVNSIVGNYLNNMTDTGVSQTLQGGLLQKTYSYSPLNALVDIVFNKAGQVVQASVKQGGGGGGAAPATSSSAAGPVSSSSSSIGTR